MKSFKQLHKAKSNMAIGIFTAHAGIHRKPKIQKAKHVLAYYKCACTIFFELFLDISLNYFFALSVTVNEVNSKHSQTSRTMNIF